MKIGCFYINRNPFNIIGVNFGKYNILRETNVYILLRVLGHTYWSGFEGNKYAKPSYNIIKKFKEDERECGEVIKYFTYDRKTKKEITKIMEQYWKEINVPSNF